MRKLRYRRHTPGTAIAAVLILLALLGVSAASAEASIPSYQDRLDAKRFARAYWESRGEYTYCAGVRMRWRNYYGDANLRGSLAYQLGCTLTFNKGESWGKMHGYGWGDDWWRFCATAIHEYGHLPGIQRPHNRQPDSLMAVAESLNWRAWWWPYHPACRYQNDDEDGDGTPDYRERG